MALWLERASNIYDPTMIVMAVGVAIANAYLLIRLSDRLHDATPGRRRQLQVLTGALAGTVIWASQVLVIIGFRWDRLNAEGLGDHGPDFGYDIMRLLMVLPLSIGALTLMTLTMGRSNGIWRCLAQGAGIGLTAVSVNFAALTSLQAQGTLHHDPMIWFLAGVFSSAIGGVGLIFLQGPLHLRRPLLGFPLILLNVAGMMSLCVLAVELRPDASVSLPSGLLARDTLAVIVLAMSALVTVVGLIFCQVDLASSREAEDRYRHLAMHDPLTGLPNRARLSQELERLLGEGASAETRASDRGGATPAHGRPQAQARGAEDAAKRDRRRGGARRAQDAREGASFAVVGVDLDRFKPVNDVQGHAAGDAVLVGIARRAEAILGPGEILTRTGGDEFIAVKSPCDRMEADRFARRLHAAIVAPIDWMGASLSVGASLGVALYPADGTDADALLTRVDLALYRAKKEAGDAVRFYNRRMDEALRDRSALAMDLRKGLIENEFELHYQPQTSLSDRHVVAYEALIRWRRPNVGLVMPDDFIPVAESTGLIRDIGAWVLHQACRDAVGWPEALGVAVNVSPVQLAQSDFVETVRDALLVSGLDPVRLELEVTEASMIADHAQLRAVMVALKEIGVRVAMDDYGAGYASLAALRSFPFDKIKIDRGFVESLGEDPQSAAIVRSTLLLGRALSIPVLAEGVSSEAGLRILRDEGCAEGQGFLFGRPLSGRELNARLRAEAQAPLPPLSRDDATSAAVADGHEADAPSPGADAPRDPVAEPGAGSDADPERTVPPSPRSRASG